ncbi:unnamed protein product [Ectocarpus fasciculatus]
MGNEGTKPGWSDTGLGAVGDEVVSRPKTISPERSFWRYHRRWPHHSTPRRNPRHAFILPAHAGHCLDDALAIAVLALKIIGSPAAHAPPTALAPVPGPVTATTPVKLAGDGPIPD